MTPTNPVFIYTLSEPSTGVVRYVGKTKNPKERYKAHKNKCRDGNTHKRNWINKLRNINTVPVFEIVDEVPECEWRYWEVYWIQQFKQWGFDLCNYGAGGEGADSSGITSFKPRENMIPVLKVSLDGVVVSRYEGIIDVGFKICHALDKIGHRSRGFMWFKESTWNSLTKEQIHEYIDAVNTPKILSEKAISTQFKKGVRGWNAGKTYTHTNKRPAVSDETRKLLSDSLKGRRNTGRSKQVNQICMITNTIINTFPSAAEAKRETRIYVGPCLSGAAKSAGGYFWEYKKAS